MLNNLESGNSNLPKVDTKLDNQIQFVEFMLESTKHDILVAIKHSLIELKRIKEEQSQKKV